MSPVLSWQRSVAQTTNRAYFAHQECTTGRQASVCFAPLNHKSQNHKRRRREALDSTNRLISHCQSHKRWAECSNPPLPIVSIHLSSQNNVFFQPKCCTPSFSAKNKNTSSFSASDIKTTKPRQRNKAPHDIIRVQ